MFVVRHALLNVKMHKRISASVYNPLQYALGIAMMMRVAYYIV